MANQIFVNVPVKDLDQTMSFFKKLGFTFNAQFTDEKAACMIVGPNIYFMLLTEEFFKTFTTKFICDTKTTTEALFAISAESKEEVNKMVDQALAAGGKEPRPASDLGFMYSRAFEDIDGHIWEVVWMDPKHVQ